MAMGEFESGVRPRDLYLLARSPEGELRAVMRFIAHRGKLSLDTMRRVGETPNGLNEALVCRALEVARERGVREVSLNYAGLGHLVRTGPSGGPIRRGLTRAVLRLLAGRFQMERLVRFNEKFAPEWRPRYLVYDSRRALLAEHPARSPGRGLPAGARPALRRRRSRVPPAGVGARRCRSAGSAGSMRRLRFRVLLAAAALALITCGVAGAYSYGRDYYVHRGFAALANLPRAGTGRLLQVSFYSPSLHRQADYLVYLPPGYNPAQALPGVLPPPRLPGAPGGVHRHRQHGRAPGQPAQPGHVAADDPRLPGRPNRREHILGLGVGEHASRQLRELRSRCRAQTSTTSSPPSPTGRIG